MKWLSLLFPLSILLTACMTISADQVPQGIQPTLEESIYDWMLEHEPLAIANTLAILQVVPLAENLTGVLISYQPEDWTDGWPVLAPFMVENMGERLIAQGYDYSPESLSSDSMISLYNASQKVSYSAVYGFVLDRRVKYIAITWEDGLEQVIQVKQETYLSIRLDQPALKVFQVVPLNAQGYPFSVPRETAFNILKIGANNETIDEENLKF